MPDQINPRRILANFTSRFEKEFLSRIEEKDKWEPVEIAFEFRDAEFVVLADTLNLNADSEQRP